MGGENETDICSVERILQPGKYSLAGNISSQFITGLLFALPLLDGDSTLSLTTKLESAGYVDLSIDVLTAFGIKLRQTTSPEGLITYEIPGGQTYVEPDGLTIEGDWSNAGFWLACGALGGDIVCSGLNMDSSQRDKEFANILQSMGANLTFGSDYICVKGQGFLGRKPGLNATVVSVAQIPDVVPVLSAAMAVANGSSMITDAERLKIKESNRLATVCDVLSSLGADITDGGTGLSITGLKSLKGGHVDGHNDHRIVMMAAVASCMCKEPVIIHGAEAVEKSYPDFFKDFASLGGQVTVVEERI
jgi:3-phosphoshikimate 1-carboxyvinyltransferase